MSHFSTRILFAFGNDTIDRYPPTGEAKIEKLLIFTAQVFKVLKKEFSVFKTSNQEKPNKKKQKTKPAGKHASKSTQEKIITDYQPSNIIHAQESAPWRWRRVNEWFAQMAQYNK